MKQRALVCLAPLALSAILGLAACGGGDSSPMDMMPMNCQGPTGLLPGQRPPDSGTSAFQVRESLGQLHVTHAQAMQELELLDAGGATVASGTADAQGSLLFRRLAPGSGYRVRVKGQAATQSRALTVAASDGSTPPACFYQQQKLKPGLNYITTRDGTTLSAYVTLPGPAEEGPYPTVVNYSGYDPSRPGTPIEMYRGLCGTFPSICDPPSDPSGLLISFFGYATVSVNMRGTGCSGGAYDFFETLQLLDGYDIIETVAAQDFALNHKVGMTGLSYPGISQLFVAATTPPSLAAITPLSVIGNTATTLFPGGILNTGFAVEWVESVVKRAAPYGQGWEQARVTGGDLTCAENQLLHDQRVNNDAVVETTKYYDPALVDPLNPSLFVNKINVPVFLAGAWQDEQTGPFFTQLLDRFTGSPLTRFMVYNGVHPDGFAPQVMAEWVAFLDLFVARRVPTISNELRGLAPVLFDQIYGATMTLPADRFAGQTSYEAVLAAYQKEPRLRAFFENGAGDAKHLGAPQGTFSLPFSGWPPKETQASRVYLRTGGTLTSAMPAEAGASSFKLDEKAGDKVVLVSGDVNEISPKYDWQPLQAGLAVAFETAALAEDQLYLGTGSVDLYVRSTANDADLQVTLSEVRADGKEQYIQSGWLRASLRSLSATRSTELWPEITMLEKDAKALVPGEWTPVRVALAGFGHLVRKGSRLRLAIDTPGGTRARWRFALTSFPDPVTIAVGHSLAHPSSLALPLIRGVALPQPLPAQPACGVLRGQPCRDYQTLSNTPAQE